MARKFRDLVARKPAAWHAEVEVRRQELLVAMPLQELRRARQLSQEQLAEELGAREPPRRDEPQAASGAVGELPEALHGERGRLSEPEG